jgi:flagellin-like hook-associated protein FlgL
MTRINTNVSSLNAQKTLARSNASLQESLTRLSTGLRINAGKDDPAGLIASEVLRADIVSVERAITNSQRANQMIATADSALGQVSALLNDIRGLVSEAANTGAMSDEQIAANQLQVDSSLEAIDRISQVTQFQGKRLLDGNLDFITEGLDSTKISDLQIDQANFGTQSDIDVSIDVVAQATQAQLNYGYGAIADDVVLEIGGANGFEAFSFAANSTIEEMAAAINLVSDALGVTAQVETAATKGAITASSFGADNDITITADTAGADEGNIRLKFTANRTGNNTLTASYTAASGTDPGTLDVQLETEKWQSATWTVNGDLDNTADNAFRITANITGDDYDGLTVVITDNGDAAEAVTYTHSNKTLTIDVDSGGTTDVDAIRALVTGNARLNSLFTITNILGSAGTGVVVAADNANVAVENAGVTGGTIESLANDVISKINATSTLNGDVTAALATGSDGHELVTAFEEYAFYGSADANNRLQFLAPEGTRDVRFVSTPGQSLSVDLSTDPEVQDFSSAIVQSLDADTSFKITAKTKGAEYDDIEIVIADVAAAAAVAVWSPEDKKLTINVDIAAGGDTVGDVIGFINNNDTVSKYFRAEVWGATADTAVLTNANFVGTVATTSGGVTSEGTVIVNLETDANGVIQTTANDLISYFDDSANAATLSSLGISISNASGSDGTGKLGATTSDLTFATSGTDLQDSKATGTMKVANGINAMFDITAKIAGAAYEGVTVVFEDVGSEAITYDSIAKTLTISIDEGTTTADDVVDMFTDPTNHAGASAAVLEAFTAALTLDVYGSGVNSSGAGTLEITDTGTLTGGTTDAGTSDGAALLGNSDLANTGLTFKAADYGSDAFVSIKALNNTSFNVTDASGASAERVAGTDINARLNGVQAIGKGLNASINTSALDLSFSVNSSVADGDTLTFSITGGGAQFQLGPDVVSNQQARLGITSVNTAKLGGASGRLFELRSGNNKSLNSDVKAAATVVEDVITQIVNLRGRLGAFQRTTLDTNIESLSDTLENLTAAESDIRDADFAKESASLTKAQILVQSGLSVLSIANSNPQSVLSLLR